MSVSVACTTTTPACTTTITSIEYPTIKRSQLIEATRRTLEQFEDELTDQDRHCYMAIAEHIDLLTPNWSAEVYGQGERCGCLVGSLRMKRLLDPTPSFDGTEFKVGVAFPDHLHKVLYGKPIPHPDVSYRGHYGFYHSIFRIED